MKSTGRAPDPEIAQTGLAVKGSESLNLHRCCQPWSRVGLKKNPEGVFAQSECGYDHWSRSRSRSRSLPATARALRVFVTTFARYRCNP